MRTTTAFRRSALRLAVVMLFAGMLIGALMPRLFATDEPAPPAPRVHVVHPGETIWGLAQRVAPGQDARRFVYEVIELNDLRQPALFPGQRLLLPAS
jgi:hypothetical protein